MTDTHRLEEVADRHAHWVAMWQQAVRASRSAIGLAELSTARFIALSPRAAELLGTTVANGVGLSYLSVAEPPGAASEAFRLARTGTIDGAQARRRLRRPDGSMVCVQATGWAIRSPSGPDLGLWMAWEVHAPEHGEAENVHAPAFPRHPHPEVQGDHVTLDDGWRVAHICSTADSLLGRAPEELIGSSLIELTHPDDFAALLFALARATTDASAHTRVRLRHRDGTWREAQVAPAIVEGDPETPVALFLKASDDPDESAPDRRLSEVPEHLRRIADQIEAARLLAPLAETTMTLGIAATTDLSPRQWEIVSRLLRGQRVPTIAAEIYLSPNTVRNHLSAVFAKVGVHSQEELLALYRGHRSDEPPKAQ
jgi:DNA-binding CsgD family transcriptional regulator/PAS domain-containing protein